MNVGNENSKIAIFGGGRWARVMLGVFLSNTDKGIHFTVHTKNLRSDMLQWARKSGFKDRISVTEDYPNFESSNYLAAVIANASYEHKHSAENAISSQIPVLIEKPITMSYSDTLELLSYAETNNTLLSVSRVFFYTTYLDKFISQIGEVKNINFLEIIWTDGPHEWRYGEQKSYDSATPIYKDILPHVISILFKITRSNDLMLLSCHVTRGGSRVVLNARILDIECRIILERNSDNRRRKIVASGAKEYVLDFTVEPGEISVDSTAFVSDRHWGDSPSPLELMAIEFLELVRTQELSDNVSKSLALSTSKFTDQVEVMYTKSIEEWLRQSIQDRKLLKSEIQYFINEFVCGELQIPRNRSVAIVQKYLDIICSDDFMSEFEAAKKNSVSNGVFDFIKMLKVT